MTIQIITDSACDMPKSIKERYHIQILPLYVTQDDTLYRDGVDIHPTEIYESMARGVVYKTSQIPYADYFSCFKDYAEKNQPALYLCFSSGLSGTYQTARLARRDVLELYPDAQIEVYDTKAVLGGLGLLVEQVGAAASMGADMESLLKLAAKCTRHVHHIFTVSDLQYLYRGGRLNRGTAMVGNALKIRPFLVVDEKGELGMIDKARGEKRLLKKMIDFMGSHSYDIKRQQIYICQAACQPMVDEFIKMVGKAFGNDNIEVMPMAPIIGTHTGPGTLTVFFFDKKIN